MPNDTVKYTPEEKYETNPFTLAADGIKNLFRNAKGVFWLALIIGFFNASNYLVDASDNQEETQQRVENALAQIGAEQWLAIAGFVLVIVAGIIAISVVVWGITGYTAYRLSKGEGVTLGEAFNAALENFWRLFATGFILTIRVIGWTLLLIVPGIIMSVRYALAPTIVFAEPKLKPGQVVSKSAQLTKGAWFDTFGALTLIPMLSLGILDTVTDIAAQSKLYKQLTRLKESRAKKPDTHFLSYLPFALLVAPLLIGLIVAFFYLLEQA